MKLLIRKGRLVDPVGGIGGVMDILIEDGKLAVIGSDLREPEARVIDARGLNVCAGLVDMHVHLREPGFEYKEDITTGAAAAARGGFTSVACMPNTRPVLDTPEQIEYVLRRAGESCGVRVWPIGAVSRGQKGQSLTDAAALQEAGCVALSDDGVPVQDANLVRDAMIRCKRLGLTILSHCEDADMVRNYAVNEGRVSRALGLPGRPAIAEEIMVMRDAMLAEETGAAVHICHVSTAGSVEIIRQFKKKGVAITCETCPQYFTLTEDKVLEQGSLARVNPPLRTKLDVEAILEGLRDGTIDVYHTGFMDLSDILKKMTFHPACILRIPKGRLSLGGEADFTIFSPDEEWTVEPDQFASKGRNTPFKGRKLKGRVKYTIVGGRVVYGDEGGRADVV